MEPQPVFVKTLTDTDVNHRLCFPTKHLGIFSQVAGEFGVSCGDEVQMFCCRTRNKGPLKPVIQRGWAGLVKDKGVQVGDELEFYMGASDDGAIHYWIKVYRYRDYHDEMGTTRIINRIV